MDRIMGGFARRIENRAYCVAGVKPDATKVAGPFGTRDMSSRQLCMSITAPLHFSARNGLPHAMEALGVTMRRRRS
jgi:hypothetical protein